MIILHVMDVVNSKGNGVAVAVNNYIKYENKTEKVALYCLNDIVRSDCDIYTFNNYNSISKLPNPFCNPDLVIFNEVYKPKYIKLSRECLKRNLKYIVIPHGCLVYEAQKKHKLKKIIGNFFLFNNFIYNANAVQFLNEREKNNSSFKYKKAIITGNGVDKPLYKNKWVNNNKDLVFIGRYEIKHKGLDLLVKICKENYKWFFDNNVKIQLYGRDSGNEINVLKKMIIGNNIEDILIVNGPVYDDDKIKVLKNAYAFIQCSRFEGQPMGIIEALSVGVPCILTYGTYLGEYVFNNKCGIACDFDSNDVFNAIKKIYSNERLRNEFSKNAYKESNIFFYWDNVIDKTLLEYKKL